MASFGAKYPRFAKIKTEPAAALPTYDPPVTIGRMIKGDLTLTFASGKLYADDALAESVDEFVSGSIALETDDILDDVAAEIYGATVTAGLVDYKAGDSPPMGGLAYYKVLVRGGVKLYKGFYYPRVKAALGNDTAQTKADSITFGTSTTTLTVYQSNIGTWRQTEEFDDEAEVIAWVNKKLGVTESGG